MSILTWILIGVIGGVVTSVITRHTDIRSIFINIIVGVVGAVAGGFSANLVTVQPAFALSIASVFVAILGALVFLSVGNAVQRR